MAEVTTPATTTPTATVGPALASPPVRRVAPVKWLSAVQLARTAVEVVQATKFAEYADQRQAMGACPREFYNLLGTGDVWVDYVADTGDGFDATFATARCIAGGVEDSVEGAEGEFVGRPQAADLLVLGGDEVYPVASRKNYLERLHAVLGAARAGVASGPTPLPSVVALPGNHDWYDGLSAFRRSFCESWVKGRTKQGWTGDGTTPVTVDVPEHIRPDKFGGWGTFQSRSYFAVKLREGWWLWGVDTQLDAPIDAEQLSYFRDAAKELRSDNLILCTATSAWLEAGGEPLRTQDETPLFTILWFIDRILGEAKRHQIRLILSGDLHHFSWYKSTDADAPQLITCGGGGAFLSSTHHLPSTLRLSWRPWSNNAPQVIYTKVCTYPDSETSAGLLRLREKGGFIRATWRNGPSLPLLIGTLDFWALLLPLLKGRDGRSELARRGALLLAALWAFAKKGAEGHPDGPRRRANTALLAIGHATAHLASAGIVSAATRTSRAGKRIPTAAQAAAFAALGAAGATILAGYLRVADQFGFHELEAFSGLRIEDYKCHLRIRVEQDKLVVYVIAIDQVPPTADPVNPPQLSPRILETITIPCAEVSS